MADAELSSKVATARCHEALWYLGLPSSLNVLRDHAGFTRQLLCEPETCQVGVE